MALQLLAANNAQSVLAAGISASATSLTLNTGTGALFPSPVSGTSFFKLTLIDAATGSLTEIVHVTARAGDVFTIQRGQEGTVPRAWSANDIAANMMTAGTLSYILGNFQPLDPTLTALAALVGVANKLPYFTGNDTAAQTDLTSVGRDIIGKNTIADILTYLGLGDASGYVGRLLKIQVFTASGTVTKTPGAKKWRIKCLGAGGGSSAAPATGSNEVSVSNGGGAGAYAEGIYDVSSITTASVVIGSGGAGGTAGSIYGADGGTSSVGSFISSPGGKAGLPAGPANPPFQPVANSNSDSSTGWNIVGSSGAGAGQAVAVANSYAIGSRGSNSIFGVGGSVPAINNPANPGGGYGSGASGCSNGPSQSAKSGAAGRPGIVIIEELA